MKNIKEILNNIINEKDKQNEEIYIYLDNKEKEKSQLYIEPLEINIEDCSYNKLFNSLLIEKTHIKYDKFTSFEDLKNYFEISENYWNIETLKPISRTLNLIYATNYCNYDFSELLKSFDEKILFHYHSEKNYLDFENHIFVYLTNLVYLDNKFYPLIKFKIFDINLKVKFKIFFLNLNDILYVSHNNKFFVKFQDYYDYQSESFIDISKLKSGMFSKLEIEELKIKNIVNY